MELNNYTIVIILSLVVLLSHFFDRLSKAFRVPSVLLLLGLGALLRYISFFFGFEVYNMEMLVQLFGIIGLILIVLEGTLDLKITAENLPLVRRSFVSALAVLVLSTLSVAYLLVFLREADFRSAFANAIPLAVISSAIAIPSACHLVKTKKDFIVCESVFSDILGILAFSLAVNGALSGLGLAVDFFWKAVLVIFVSALFSLLLVLSVSRLKIGAKFHIILANLILMYALGNLLHLPSLLLVLSFGLLLGNYTFFTRWKLDKLIDFSEMETELERFRLIVMESAFLIRTFFFVFFGYSINLAEVMKKDIIFTGTLIVLILLVVRFLYLRFFVKVHLFPELFIAPRGLVTILLFYSIPAELALGSFGKEVMFFVIVSSSLLMIFAFSIKKQKLEETETEYL